MSSAENPQALEQIRAALASGSSASSVGARRVHRRRSGARRCSDEVGRALDRRGVDALGRVGRAVELGHPAVRVEAADRDRGKARHRGLRRVGADAPDVRLGPELLAQPHQALVAAEHERVAVARSCGARRPARRCRRSRRRCRAGRSRRRARCSHARMPSVKPSLAPGNTSHVSTPRGRAAPGAGAPTSSSAATPEALVGRAGRDVGDRRVDEQHHVGEQHRREHELDDRQRVGLVEREARERRDERDHHRPEEEVERARRARASSRRRRRRRRPGAPPPRPTAARCAARRGWRSGSRARRSPGAAAPSDVRACAGAASGSATM